MYGSIPYMVPNVGMSAAPVANGLSSAANLSNAANTTGILGRAGSLFSKINWGSLLSNAQKTLNVVNHAIPFYYQVKPVFKNIKTLGRIGKEFTKIGNSNTEVSTSNTNAEQSNISAETTNNAQTIPEPTFFL